MTTDDEKKFGLDDTADAGSQGQMVPPAGGGSHHRISKFEVNIEAKENNKLHGSVCPVVIKPSGQMAAVKRSFKPMIDSGSVVSTCPPWYAPGVATKKTKYHLNLESVLGEKLKHYGFKEGVAYKNGLGDLSLIHI